LSDDTVTNHHYRMLKEGDPAPAFSAQTDNDTPLSLAALRGQRVVLYFYPKDDTPG
jgi:peroxiredoxin Q/BCP